MKHAIAGLTLAGLTATLAGCGQDEPTTTQAEPATVTVTVTSEPEDAGQEQPAGDAEQAQDTESAVPTTEAAPASEEAAEQEPEDGGQSEKDFGEQVFSDRGNLIKEVGQWAGISSYEDQDRAVVYFRVTELETDFACTSDWAEAPENGHFVALTFQVETTPELAEEDVPQFWITSHDLTVFDDDGNRENDSIGTSYSCLDEQEQLPADIGPGQKASGKIVIDTGANSGWIHLGNVMLGMSGGWEWRF